MAKEVAEKLKVGVPSSDESWLGPVVSETQYNKVQRSRGRHRRGRRARHRRPRRPEGLNRGYYVRPHVFAGV